jgi:hypothetical protein
MPKKKREVGRMSESDMAQAVSRYLGKGRSTREVKVGGCRFDIVSYDTKKEIFKLVECKLATRPSSIGRTFGQLAAYYAAVADRGYEFVTALSEKLHLSFDHLMQATHGATKIHVEFYVALTHEACLNLPLLESLKRLLPKVGIIRVKPGGKCRGSLLKGGEKYKALSPAKAMTIRIHGTT